MDRAVVWDARHTVKIEGKVVQRGEKGITIEDANGVRLYATTDRVISDTGLDKLLEPE